MMTDTGIDERKQETGKKSTGDVQALSHQLHPSILDNLGLATAVKSFCREVAEQRGVMVELTQRAATLGHLTDCVHKVT
jgi:signal transduction histidine kinase